VWARAEGIAEPARFPAGVLAEVWSQKGWSAAAPPEPLSPFNGDRDVPGSAPSAVSSSATPAESTTSKPAAGGNAKEK
jgi:hypothetical protein